jgi:hypothetical protein
VRLAVLLLLLSSPAAFAQVDDPGCEPVTSAPQGILDVAAALRAACVENALLRAAAEPPPAGPGAAERLGARLTGPWTDAERALLDRVLALLPPALVDRMRVGEIRRTKEPVVEGRVIPNAAVFTPNGGGLLQVGDEAFDREPARAMVVVLHELLHSTQLTSTGRPRAETSAFFEALTGWKFEIVSTGIFRREYRWSHDGRPIYIGPNYGEGLFPPDNALEEMVAAMVDYVAAPDYLRHERPAMYERLRTAFFDGREYRCGR